MTRLPRSEQLLALAREVLCRERQHLAALGVPGDIALVGGASVPGALTVGDVDLHLRVPETESFRFTRCRELLAADPALFEQYNAVKRSAVGTPTYSAQKSAFFDHLLELWPRSLAAGGSATHAP